MPRPKKITVAHPSPLLNEALKFFKAVCSKGAIVKFVGKYAYCETWARYVGDVDFDKLEGDLDKLFAGIAPLSSKTAFVFDGSSMNVNSEDGYSCTIPVCEISSEPIQPIRMISPPEHFEKCIVRVAALAKAISAPVLLAHDRVIVKANNCISVSCELGLGRGFVFEFSAADVAKLKKIPVPLTGLGYAVENGEYRFAMFFGEPEDRARTSVILGRQVETDRLLTFSEGEFEGLDLDELKNALKVVGAHGDLISLNSLGISAGEARLGAVSTMRMGAKFFKKPLQELLKISDHVSIVNLLNIDMKALKFESSLGVAYLGEFKEASVR